MKINPKTHYFEDLNNSEAMELLNLAELIHERKVNLLDYPILKDWMTIVNPTNGFIINAAIYKEYLPVRLAISAARYFAGGISKND
jgi:hypothetical protein